MARKRTHPEIETQLFLASRRRCAFCFGLNGDVQEKKGQIAHVDHDPSNSDFENLVFLCMEHHDQYDSRTTQSKGLTQKELLAYRGHLYEYVKDQMPISWPDATPVKGKTSKKHPGQISVELYDRRLKIYHSARDLIIYVIRSASVDLQR